MADKIAPFVHFFARLGFGKTYTTNHLNEYVAFNAKYSGGQVAGYSLDGYKTIKARELKAFYMSKFIFTGEGLNFLLLKERLWHWGEVCLYKFKNKILIGGFVLRKKDHENNPLKVDFVPISQANAKKPVPLSKNLTVGKDCIIMRAGPGYLLNERMFYTPFFLSNKLLDGISLVRRELFKNLLLGRTILGVPADSPSNYYKAIEKMLLSGATVIPLGEEFNSAKLARTSTSKILDDFKDRTKELIMNYNHFWDELKSALGADTNNNPDKQERQIEMELSKHNALSSGINETELEYITNALEKVNKLFKINLSVKLRQPEQKPEIQQEKGGD